MVDDDRLHPVAHTASRAASRKGARGRQGVKSVSWGHVGGPVGEEVMAVVAQPSPVVEVGRVKGDTELWARGGGGRLGLGRSQQGAHHPPGLQVYGAGPPEDPFLPLREGVKKKH